MKIDDWTRTDDGGISFSAEVYKTHLKKAEKDGKPVDTQNTEDNSPAYIIDINDLEDTHQKMTVNISKEVLDRYKESGKKAFKLSPESMEKFKHPGYLGGDDGLGPGLYSSFVYPMGICCDPDNNPLIHQVKKLLEGSCSEYNEIKALLDGTNTDMDHYNKLFAKATADAFYGHRFQHDYSDNMFSFINDITNKTGKSVIGDRNHLHYVDNTFSGDYTAYYSYDDHLVTVSEQMLDFMANNRQDDDIWTNFINEKYSDMNEVVQALQNKGDIKAAQTMQDNLNKSVSTTGSTKFKNNYNNDLWDILKYDITGKVY